MTGLHTDDVDDLLQIFVAAEIVTFHELVAGGDGRRRVHIVKRNDFRRRWRRRRDFHFDRRRTVLISDTIIGVIPRCRVPATLLRIGSGRRRQEAGVEAIDLGIVEMLPRIRRRRTFETDPNDGLAFAGDVGAVTRNGTGFAGGGDCFVGRVSDSAVSRAALQLLTSVLLVNSLLFPASQLLGWYRRTAACQRSDVVRRPSGALASVLLLSPFCATILKPHLHKSTHIMRSVNISIRSWQASIRSTAPLHVRPYKYIYVRAMGRVVHIE
jgi:hypothetical protein